jgi:hypothetical protein
MPRRAMLAATALAAALALATSAGAGLPGTPDITGAKHEAGPYRFLTHVRIHRPRDLYVKVRNTSGHLQHAVLRQGLLTERQGHVMRFTWFSRKRNISDEVKTPGGYEFRLRVDRPRRFRVHAKPLVAHTGKLCLYSEVEVTDPAAEASGAFFTINDRGENACVA